MPTGSAANDLVFWPAGQSLRAVSDTELVMFSPQKEQGEVIDHLIATESVEGSGPGKSIRRSGDL